MGKLFVVTDGSYSDYRIVGIWDIEVLANKYIQTYSGRIEEWELNPTVIYPPIDHRVYYVKMLKDGTTVSCIDVMEDEQDLDKCQWDPYLSWDDYVSENLDLYPAELLRVKESGHNYSLQYYIDAIISAYILATSPEHAIKIASEKRAQLIAMNQWKRDKDVI